MRSSLFSRHYVIPPIRRGMTLRPSQMPTIDYAYQRQQVRSGMQIVYNAVLMRNLALEG